ncbi:tRNA 2-thiouridine(34) synthase MnmA [Candidatus Uhrbacteria bacterium]|nr:tRNA 2-thiouridine(34) synthase MnmA [Candidatus Uhrbacteria bacterium]
MQKTVLVGMSGGVDSSVTAALLVREGYRVIGGFIKNWSDSKELWTGECAWRSERRDAMRVAARIGIPLITFDFEKNYREKVVAEIFRGYEAGETPNPDVLCNEAIKFGLFYDEAMKLGADYVATGHYACIDRIPKKEEVHLIRGIDPNKDQSYFLYRVPQNVLQKTLFPIGNLYKTQVRKLATEFSLPIAEKPDSQGICFIGKLDMQEFLRKKIPAKPGDIVDEKRNILGKHSGLDGYTIGQRHGIHVSKGEQAWYVAKKDMKTNQLMIVQGAEHPLLFQNSTILNDLHWTRGLPPTANFDCVVQVRYRQNPISCHASMKSNGQLELIFAQPVKAVAPGQSAVLYQENECLGGGVISVFV